MTDRTQPGTMDLIRKTSEQARSGRIQEMQDLDGVEPSGQAHLEDYPGDEPLPKSEAGTTRTLIRLASTEDLQTAEQQADFAGEIADGVIAAMNTELARRGEPPLKK
jgi:hypothetical protein